MSVKILIVSDSHGNNRNLIQAVKNMRGTMDMMIHLGDMECSPDSIRSLVERPVEMVKGNCDYGNELQGARLIEIGEHKAFITHGNRYGGELGIPTMKDIAKENGADIVMFGHSHKPVIDTKSDIVVLNPGSISRPRQDGFRPTYLVMNIEDDGRTDYVLVTL